VAARTLADVGDVTRFADRNRFASWTGTAPLDASSSVSPLQREGVGAIVRADYVVSSGVVGNDKRQVTRS
jgi:transposase